ncbi:MAG: ATP-binding protein [Bdellovibrio sp.]
MNFLDLIKSFISKFGFEITVVILIGWGLYYFQGSTSVTSNFSTREFQSAVAKIKDVIEQAEAAEKTFIKSGKKEDLEKYNKQVVLLNYSMGSLNKLAALDSVRKLEVLRLNDTLKKHFESVNEVMVKRQNGQISKNRVPAFSSLSQIVDNSFSPMPIKDIFIPSKNTLYAIFGGLIFLMLLSRFLQRQELIEQKEETLTLQRRSVLLDTILNSMSEALIVIDNKGRFTHYNAAAQRIVGTKIKEISLEKSAEILGFFNTLTGEIYSLKQLPFYRALSGEQVDDLEIFVQNDTHPEGVYISLSSRSLNDINGGISGALIVFKDISRRKAIEQEWIRAREAALEASLKKSDFLAAMSHEIRTPMNGVIGMTTLLSDTSLNEEQQEYVGIVKRSAESLLMLINDILDHSKIEAGKVQLVPQPFDLQFLAHDVIEIFKPKITEKNIELKLEFKGPPSWYFVGDQGRFRQILVNLIGNAVKFTEKGFVALRISQSNDLEGNCNLKFEIQDTGPGLNDEERRSLFQKYFQTKDGTKYGGTGLGLSICKQLVNLMDGDIGVESVVGLGSTFWFSVTLLRSGANEIVRAKSVQFAPIFTGSVLLVEDQLVNQRVAQTYLRKLGLQVDTASNGLVAYQKCLTQQYDIVLMDCQMPVLNGFEATMRIRKNEMESGKKKMPIVALTADTGHGDKARYFECGMDDFLAKPLELSPLVETLHRYLVPLETIDLNALSKLEEYSVSDQNLVEVLIQDLEQSAPGLIESMKHALKKYDLEGITVAAHALKSSSATLGAMKLAELCATLEELTEIDRAESFIKQIEAQFLRSMMDLKRFGAQKKAA